MNGVAQTMNGEGLEIKIRHSANAPGFFRIEARTPEDVYDYGDYATLQEAQARARDMIDDRSTWSGTLSGDCWRPIVWQSMTGTRGGREFWRRGPRGTTLSVSQPHGIEGVWRMYWEGFPIVSSGHDDLGIFDTPFEAIGVLESLATDEMRSALLD
ncbi:hypothetical protein [Bradyrhizobium sp. S3.2.12]|uniref:hypothetical protein n=1 Tax=Bradyrhizobium sp. S3.2.12 TaxID=3156387 RepID=UPI0033967325